MRKRFACFFRWDYKKKKFPTQKAGRAIEKTETVRTELENKDPGRGRKRASTDPLSSLSFIRKQRPREGTKTTCILYVSFMPEPLENKDPGRGRKLLIQFLPNRFPKIRKQRPREGTKTEASIIFTVAWDLLENKDPGRGRKPLHPFRLRY